MVEPSWFWNLYRLEVFVVLVSGLVDRPLPPIELVSTIGEMTRDQDRDSIAQRTRPHPRWRYAWNWLRHGGAVVALIIGLFGHQRFGFPGAILGAAGGLAAILFCKLGARVMAALGGDDLNPGPPCDIVDPVMINALTPEWASCPPRKLKRCTRELAKGTAEQHGCGCWIHSRGWPCWMVHADQKGLLTALEEQTKRCREVGETTMVQQKGRTCGYTIISSALRSIPGASQLYLRYGPYSTFLTLPAAEVVVKSIAARWPGANVKAVTVIGCNGLARVSGSHFRRELNAIQNQRVRLLVTYSVPVLESRKCDKPWIERLEDLSGAHWTLVVGYDSAQDVVAMYDPRAIIGMRLVPADRLLAAINTRCCVTFKRRGMIKIEF